VKRWLLTICLSFVLSDCASLQSAQPEAAPLVLGLARADGRNIALSAYAGQPLLLFLFTTYDQGSQLALANLTKFLAQHAGVQVAGVLLQPDAATFLPLFKEAVSIPFELYYDPGQRILQGESALGKLVAVPAFVALDAAGRVTQTGYGVLTAEQLEQLIAQ
jgi:peroxiredoxin